MGDACGKSMPALSASYRFCHCDEVLPYYWEVELASADTPERIRRSSYPSPSVESKSKLLFIFLGSDLLMVP